MIKIGVTLPTMAAGVDRDTVLAWAEAIDAGPFSTLAAGERLHDDTLDALVTLAACAAVTRRCRLATAALVLPLHDEIILAKQLATLDRLASGRLEVAVAVGGRRDDFAAHPQRYRRRDRLLDEKSVRMRAVWSKRLPLPEGGTAGVGPTPVQTGGPPLLIATANPALVRRAAEWADGVFAWSFDLDPEPVAKLFRAADEAWRAAGRSTGPRRVVGWYYALGEAAREQLHAFVASYHGTRAEAFLLERALRATCTDAATLRESVDAFARAGAEQAVLAPTAGSIDQLERLAEALG